MKTSISFIVPAFNEEQSLFQVLAALNLHLKELDITYEIIVVDDGSSDNTASMASRFFSENKGIGKLVQNSRNRGYGFSLKHGAREAKHDYLFFYDADGQHRGDQVAKLVEACTPKTRLIVGKRSDGRATPAWRKPGKALIKKVTKVITRTDFPDLFSGFRLWEKKSFLEMVGILPNGFSISTTSTVASQFTGIDIQWVEIEVEKRIGKSSATVLDGFRILLLLVRIITLFSPLRVFLPISVLVGILGMYFTIASYVQQEVSSIRGLIALLISLTIALQGLLVDQISALRRGEKITYSKNL